MPTPSWAWTCIGCGTRGDEIEAPPEVAAKLAERDAARAARDYARADALRDEIAGRGWEVIDGPEGSTVRRRELGPVREQQVPARPEPVDDPVEVALGLTIPLLVREAGPAAMLVAGRGELDGDGAARRLPLSLVAQDQAPPDIEVAVEPEAFVEGSARDVVGAAEREAIALDRIDVPGRRLLEGPQVAAT